MKLDRRHVESIMRDHNAARPNGSGRCEHCNWDLHPCDVYNLAADWLTLTDALYEVAPKYGHDETSAP